MPFAGRVCGYSCQQLSDYTRLNSFKLCSSRPVTFILRICSALAYVCICEPLLLNKINCTKFKMTSGKKRRQFIFMNTGVSEVWLPNLSILQMKNQTKETSVVVKGMLLFRLPSRGKSVRGAGFGF